MYRYTVLIFIILVYLDVMILFRFHTLGNIYKLNENEE